MFIAIISTVVALSVLLLFFACFGLGKGQQKVDRQQLAYALEEMNPSDYNSYAVAPVGRKN